MSAEDRYEVFQRSYHYWCGLCPSVRALAFEPGDVDPAGGVIFTSGRDRHRGSPERAAPAIPDRHHEPWELPHCQHREVHHDAVLRPQDRGTGPWPVLNVPAGTLHPWSRSSSPRSGAATYSLRHRERPAICAVGLGADRGRRRLFRRHGGGRGRVDDDRISFVNLPTNSGQQAAPNNRGVAMARGRYVAFASQPGRSALPRPPGHVRQKRSTGPRPIWSGRHRRSSGYPVRTTSPRTGGRPSCGGCLRRRAIRPSLLLRVPGGCSGAS